MHYTNFNTPLLRSRIPSVVTIHDLTLWFFEGRRHRGKIKRAIYRFLIRQSCRNAARVIAISAGAKADIVKHLGIAPEKIDVIHEAVPDFLRNTPVSSERQTALRSKFNLTKPFFIYVGQWRSHKNLPRMIRAMALAKHRYQLDYQLVLVGKVDSMFPEVMETIGKLGLQSTVITTGYVADSDLAHLYRAAAAFVFPSLYEGFGLPPLEAMACGTPVISSNASVMPEVLGDAALYFDPYNIEDIAAALHRFARTISLQQSLKLRAATQVAKYSFDEMARATLAVYQRVLDERQ
jgi:glycosyltransferase involved in cell wall biosynthesis